MFFSLGNRNPDTSVIVVDGKLDCLSVSSHTDRIQVCLSLVCVTDRQCPKMNGVFDHHLDFEFSFIKKNTRCNGTDELSAFCFT